MINEKNLNENLKRYFLSSTKNTKVQKVYEKDF